MFIFRLHKKDHCRFGLQSYELFLTYAKKIAKFLRNGDFFIGYRANGQCQVPKRKCAKLRKEYENAEWNTAKIRNTLSRKYAIKLHKNAQYSCVFQKKIIPLQRILKINSYGILKTCSR